MGAAWWAMDGCYKEGERRRRATLSTHHPPCARARLRARQLARACTSELRAVAAYHKAAVPSRPASCLLLGGRFGGWHANVLWQQDVGEAACEDHGTPNLRVRIEYLPQEDRGEARGP